MVYTWFTGEGKKYRSVNKSAQRSLSELFQLAKTDFGLIARPFTINNYRSFNPHTNAMPLAVNQVSKRLGSADLFFQR